MRESKIDVTISDIEEAVPENSLDLSDNEVEIDLFNDTAAILNLLDVRNIMGCPGGTCSVFMSTFCAKRKLHFIFRSKKVIISLSKHGTKIFFSHYNLFLGKLQEKLAHKGRVNTGRVYWILLMPPGHPIILLKSK